MHTFKIEIENQDVVDKVLWFLKNLKDKGVKISNANDEFAIDTTHCLHILEKSKSNKKHDFKELSSSQLFEEMGI
jgi:hypothetical protein